MRVLTSSILLSTYCVRRRVQKRFFFSFLSIGAGSVVMVQRDYNNILTLLILLKYYLCIIDNNNIYLYRSNGSGGAAHVLLISKMYCTTIIICSKFNWYFRFSYLQRNIGIFLCNKLKPDVKSRKSRPVNRKIEHFTYWITYL